MEVVYAGAPPIVLGRAHTTGTGNGEEAKKRKSTVSFVSREQVKLSLSVDGELTVTSLGLNPTKVMMRERLRPTPLRKVTRLHDSTCISRGR